MKRLVFWLIVAAVLGIGFVYYRSRPRLDLNVDPHAHDEIEKAMKR